MDSEFKQNAIKFRKILAELELVIKEQSENPNTEKNYAIKISKLKKQLAEVTMKLHEK